MPEQEVTAERDAQHEGDPAGDSKPLRSLIQLILRTVEGGHVSNLDGLPRIRGTHTPHPTTKFLLLRHDLVVYPAYAQGHCVLTWRFVCVLDLAPLSFRRRVPSPLLSP